MPCAATFAFTIPQTLFPNHRHSGLVPLVGLPQPDQIAQIQPRVVQLSGQMAFDILPGVSEQSCLQLTALALRVLPSQKGGRFVRRRDLEYARLDV